MFADSERRGRADTAYQRRRVDDVLNADVRENLEPPPEEAKGQEQAYYAQLAGVIDRLQAGHSRTSIMRAQALVDTLWLGRGSKRDQRKPATVEDVLARAARRKTRSEPRDSDDVHTEQHDEPTKQEHIAIFLDVLTKHGGRLPVNWRELISNERRQGQAAAATHPASARAVDHQSDLPPEESPSSDQVTPTSRPPPAIAEPVVAAAAGAAPEPDNLPAPRIKPWPEEFDDVLGEMPLDPDEAPDTYIFYFNHYRHWQQPSLVRSWQYLKSYVDHMHVKEREYKKEVAANGGKCRAQIEREAAYARGDKTAIWFGD